MNQHLHSPTKLTEFARDFDDEPDTLFGRFVSKIQNAYNQSYNTVNEVPVAGQQLERTKSVFYADSRNDGETSLKEGMSRDSSSNSLNAASTQKTGTNLTAQGNHDPSTTSSSSTTTITDESSEAVLEKLDELPSECNEGRTMVNVLKRISNLMASKNSDLRNYKDTDLQRLWMPDSKAKECYDCAQKFSTFRRKHHCRLCGQIFCAKCCNQVVPGKIIKCSGDLKVCNYCSKIVLSYLKSPNIAVDLQADLQALQQDLSSKLEDKEDVKNSNILPAHISSPRKISVGYQEERFATQKSHNLTVDDRRSILQQSHSLKALQEEMQRALPSQNCGLELIEFLNANQKSSNKAQALAILGAMLAAGFLQPIVPDSDQTDFDENLHYKFVNVPRQSFELLTGQEFIPASTEMLSPQFEGSGEPQPPKSIDNSVSFHSTHDIEAETSVHLTSTTSKLLESYCDHEEQLLAQMLRSYNLDLRWAKVLTPLCCRAANHFKPEYCTNDLMDIRGYVNFKKVPGGKRQECTIVGGVVFSKNVAHKEMATRVERPRILLLQCPVVYERIEGKFVSIETVLLQEKEYLRNVCARILSFKPNVVLVHKNVAGVAQDMLRSSGITLVLDVKLSVMERLSRTLQCDILSSIESNITKPRLGICDAFYIRSYDDCGGSSKTLMFFEKLTNPRGYTCLLRGGNNKELEKVKKVASFLVYARYNWLLEMSFLLDEFAEPLSPKPPIFDSKEASPEEKISEKPIEDDEPQLRSTIENKFRLAERRSEDKILTVATENVADYTDPLRSSESPTGKASSDSSVVELAVEMRYDNRFRNALSSTLLSISPFLTFPLPYLETEQGRKCELRALFPAELYFSKQWSNANTNSQNNSVERNEGSDLIKSNKVEETLLNPPHAFLKLKITTPIDNRDIQTLLAEFRAYGARYPKKKKFFKLLKRQESNQRPQKVSDELVFKDALDITNHQRLAVLFCSFFFDSNSASSASFCATPTLLDMTFYGHQDIMLGHFLQRYCCRQSFCTVCNLPMLGHIRRYVHSMGCVQVFLSEDHTKTDPNRIFFTAWCSICDAITPSIPLSEAAKCLSLAKYLELRFHGHAYKKRKLEDLSNTPRDANINNKSNGSQPSSCQHSLHRDYVHYFSYRGVGAKFQYTPIEAWEIGLPSLVLHLQPPKPFECYQILEEVKNFSMKGHEVYTRIHERIADLAIDDENSPLVASLKTILTKDQFLFRQHIEIVQTLLIDTKANSYDINDALIMAKRALAESIELWSPRLHEISVAQKIAVKQQSLGADNSAHQVDAGLICTEDLRSEQSDNQSAVTEISRTGNDNLSTQTEDTVDTTEVSNSVTTSVLDKKNSAEHLQATQSTNSTVSDKKSIKKILIHLLPSTGPINLLQSPFLPQEHLTLPLGTFPVVVQDQDLSSVIAYTLTSMEYQRSIANLKSMASNTASSEVTSAGTGANSSPNLKRKSQETALEEEMNLKNANTSKPITINEEERTKSKSNSSHIEISFQDQTTQFTCKIYFAKEFDLMRAKTLRPLKYDKSLYKELEQKKKREELKVSQGPSGSEMELVRKPSDAGSNLKPSIEVSNGKKDDNAAEIEECRDALARSLCSSVQWEARGGKSGSRFCKTSDERFVLKEMSRVEINIFENFAPNYFEYISKCQQQNHPTLLAKIFGVFKVTIKKKDFSQEKSLLVMENLFYNCDIKNKFDLKGSERNRLVNPTNQHGEIVLLDENLVQMSWSKPLYILSHSKAVLKDAINRDSSFLEKNQVMDYSLLVGLDEKRGVLVLGIIDYIRTFTFEKRVESYIKQTGLLGGMGKLPTIISPERYKQRFTDAMDRYFYTVPDRWEGLSKI